MSSARACLLAALLCCFTVNTEQLLPAKEIKKFSVNGNTSLITALEEVQDYINSNGSGGYIMLDIDTGTYNLTGPHATTLATFNNVSNISIVGKGVDNTTIDGEGSCGFVFIEVHFLSIVNITFTNCASVQNSTSTINSEPCNLDSEPCNLDSEPCNLSFYEFAVALYLDGCSYVHMVNASVANSQAVGMAMFNIEGINTFTGSSFSNNVPGRHSNTTNLTEISGGGVILEFSFCRPGDLECNNSNPVEVANASFVFSECSFISNVVSSKNLRLPSIYPHGTDHIGFGNGGGLAVYFRGRAINNSVTLTNCKIAGNLAQLGGGLYIEFGDESQHNTFKYTGEQYMSLVDNNGPLCDILNDGKVKLGGGVMIMFVYYPKDEALWPDYYTMVVSNKVKFHGIYFSSNMACWGGGVAVVTSRASASRNQTNTILFSNCTFLKNKAVESAALGMSILQPDPSNQGQLISPVIENCTFSHNVANSRTKDEVPILSGYTVGMGAVYFESVPGILAGVNTFTCNNGTGLVVSGTDVQLKEDTLLLFEYNRGKRGGALVVIGGGSLVTHQRSQLIFNHNQAIEEGGAIYVEGQYGQRNSFYQESCFIRYYQATVSPTKWRVNITFTNNRVTGKRGSNTIYITSLLGCVWPVYSNTEENIRHTLCWPGWVYNGNNATELKTCSEFVQTAPASFNNNYNYIYNMSVYPGHTVETPILMNDDYGATVSNVVFKVTSSDSKKANVSNTSVYSSDNTISVYGVPGCTIFYLDTLDPRVLSTSLKVYIQPCPLGYIPEYEDSDSESESKVRKCKCAFSFYFTCNKTDMSANIQPGYCLSYSDKGVNNNTDLLSTTHTPQLIVVSCPATVKKTKPITLPRCNNTCDLDVEFCAAISRRGKYCSRCSHGTTVDVNNIHNCVHCHGNNYRYGWFLYLLVTIVPITLFFIIVALFKVSATSAPMYAFLFFAQITTVRYFHNQFPWIFGLSEQYYFLQPLQLTFYSLWNLDFFIFKDIICLSPNLTIMHSLLLKYLLAFYPMLLILLSFISIELYDRNFKLVVWLWSPFRACLIKYRRSWQPRTSIIDAFATFIMISFTKITFVTISLLTPAQEYYVYRETRSAVPGGYVFYFDPQYDYFKGAHLPLGILALVVGLVFVIAPPVFLILYPTKMFQRCLNRCPRFPWQPVHTFADAFQGCFKNHTNNNRDYRYFSGLYLILRITILIIYAVEPERYVQLLLQQILCTLAVLVFALVKPYKEPFYNKVDLSMFSLLSIMNSLSFANFTNSCVNMEEMNHTLFWINYSLGFLPLIYLAAYVFYLMLKWCGCIATDPVVKQITAGKSVVSVTPEYSSTSDIPDRLLRPECYSSNTGTSKGTLSSDVSESEGEDSASRVKNLLVVNSNDGRHRRPQMRATEGSYFLNKARSMKNYSSM